MVAYLPLNRPLLPLVVFKCSGLLANRPTATTPQKPETPIIYNLRYLILFKIIFCFLKDSLKDRL